jgi:hypothetical protein
MINEILDSGVPDAGAQPTPIPTGKFLGYTSGAYPLAVGDGLGGIFNTYAACQSDFGETARICAIDEVLGTAGLPAAPPEEDGGTRAGAWLLDSSTTVSGCWWVGRINPGAPFMTPQGGFDISSCADRRVLACCTVD